jgi:hypothetical protein
MERASSQFKPLRSQQTLRLVRGVKTSPTNGTITHLLGKTLDYSNISDSGVA